MTISPALRRDIRLAAISGACGLAAGILLAVVLISRYGDGAGGRQRETRAAAPADADRWQDGLGSIDAPSARPNPAPTSGGPVMESAGNVDAVRELKDRDLDVPVEGVKRDALVHSFTDARSGNRVHEALDIIAPRNTPVKAVEDGRIVKLFNSKAGGITVYQFDPSERFCYYYAHLEGYADGIQEGARVEKGQVIGYVGTSGNAPKDTPHLHFAVFRLTPEKKWWEGTPIDPYDVLR